MKNRRIILGMGLLMVLAMVVSACGGIVRGEAAPESPVEAGAPVGEVREGLAVVDEISVIETESRSATVGVVFSGNLPDGCTELGVPVVKREGTTFRVELPTTRDPDAMCTMALVPFGLVIPLDVLGLPAGTYAVDVNGVTDPFTFEIDTTLQE